MPSLSSKAFFALLLLLASSFQSAYSTPVARHNLNDIGTQRIEGHVQGLEAARLDRQILSEHIHDGYNDLQARTPGGEDNSNNSNNNNNNNRKPRKQKQLYYNDKFTETHKAEDGFSVFHVHGSRQAPALPPQGGSSGPQVASAAGPSLSDQGHVQQQRPIPHHANTLPAQGSAYPVAGSSTHPFAPPVNPVHPRPPPQHQATMPLPIQHQHTPALGPPVPMHPPVPPPTLPPNPAWFGSWPYQVNPSTSGGPTPPGDPSRQLHPMVPHPQGQYPPNNNNGGLGLNQPHPQGHNPAQQYYPPHNNNGGGSSSSQWPPSNSGGSGFWRRQEKEGGIRQ